MLNKASNVLFPNVLFNENETKPTLINKKEIFEKIVINNGINIDESMPGRE